MTEILKHSPLQGIGIGNNNTVSIRELHGLSTYDLRVMPHTSSYEAVIKELDIKLPTHCGQSTKGLEAHALCLGPDSWLIVGYTDAYKKLASLEMNDQFHFSIVDVSGQRTTIELQGSHARNVLSHLWEQDLRDKSFPVGSVSQGLMAKAPIILWHFAPSHYRIMVRSSFALHLWKALVDAAAEWA